MLMNSDLNSDLHKKHNLIHIQIKILIFILMLQFTHDLQYPEIMMDN